jgi:formate dehydrogenase maturation protein FdhE
VNLAKQQQTASESPALQNAVEQLRELETRRVQAAVNLAKQQQAASELRRQPSRALQNAVYWQQRDEELRQEQESRGKCSIQ